MSKLFIFTIGLITCMGFSSCNTMYYKAMEKVGVHKRDILVDRVEDARDAQEGAKDQFRNALEAFTSVVEIEGGELEEKYNSLNKVLVKSEQKAQAVYDRVDAVEHVSKALFKEWRSELGDYSNKELRRSSEKRLKETEARYEDLIAAMHRAEDRMEPVLKPLRDQVLFLKHNLNAKAIASLKNELTKIETDVEALVIEMEKAITEADAFISELQ